MNSRKIYDCFTFFNEQDILRLRVKLLRDVVDFFVVVEANCTHTGLAKPYNFDPSLFDLSPERFIHVKVEDMPVYSNDAWACENHQRNAILRGLGKAQSGDIIIVSDVDEIPNPQTILKFQPWYPVARLQQKFFYYCWNNLVVDRRTQNPVIWTGAKITTFRNLNKLWGTPQNLRTFTLANRTIWNRLYTRLFSRVLDDGGWHWSYIMSADKISQKIQSFAHTEYSDVKYSDPKNVQNRINNLMDPFEREDYQLIPLAAKDLFPATVCEVLERDFPEFLLPTKDSRP